jgi:hypothetical protein
MLHSREHMQFRIGVFGNRIGDITEDFRGHEPLETSAVPNEGVEEGNKSQLQATAHRRLGNWNVAKAQSSGEWGYSSPSLNITFIFEAFFGVG